MAPRPEAERSGLSRSSSSNNLSESSLTKFAYTEHTDVDHEVSSGVQAAKDASTSVQTSEEMMVVPPDGGWGWAVLLGTMIVNIVVIGHAKSFGVYFKTIIEEFEASPSRVAWMQSLQISMFSFLSPVASVLSQIIGPRKVALTGGLLACTGLILSAFTPSLEFLYIFYGVIEGIALTFTFTPGIAMIAKYFNRRRGLANGLAIAGNAIGGILMPLVVSRLVTEYSLRGCFLIMGSIQLHSCVGALLWQPVEWHQKRPNNAQEQNEGEDENEVPSETIPVPKDSSQQYIHDRLFTMENATSDEDNALPKMSNGKRYSLCVSGPDLHTTTQDSFVDYLFPRKINRGGSSPHLGEFLKNGHHHRGGFVSTESLPLAPKQHPRLVALKGNSRTSSFIYLSSYNLGPTAGAVLTKEHFLEGNHSTAATPSESLPSGDDEADDARLKKQKTKKWSMSSWLKRIKIDKTIFENSRLYIMTVSLFFHVLGYPGTQIFLPYRATMLGLSKAHAASLLSVLALTDLAGRVCCAWISDFHFCPRKYWFIGGMFMSGVFAFTLPYYTTYATLIAGTAGFGFACGAYIGLVVVLFADAYGPEKVALAYSISTVSGGFMALGGPPLMGYVLESTGSYVACQVILGSAQFVGAAVWIAEPWAVRWEKRRLLEQKNKIPEQEELV